MASCLPGARGIHHVPRGMETDPEKVVAVATWPTPCSIEDVSSFQVFCSYYRSSTIVQGFPTICHPLTQLTTKGV